MPRGPRYRPRAGATGLAAMTPFAALAASLEPLPGAVDGASIAMAYWQ